MKRSRNGARHRAGESGVVWLLKIGLIIGAGFFGWRFNCLTPVACSTILVHALLSGIWPTMRNTRVLSADKDKTHQEDDLANEIPDENLHLIVEIDASEAGSGLRLIQAIVLFGPEAGKKKFFSEFQADWDARQSGPVAAASECPFLGLLWSFVGMYFVFENMGASADTTALYAAVRVSLGTSVLGSLCFLVLSGWCRQMKDKVAAHRAFLEGMASEWSGEELHQVHEPTAETNGYSYPLDLYSNGVAQNV